MKIKKLIEGLIAEITLEQKYLKKILTNDVAFKKIWSLYKDIHQLHKKYGVGIWGSTVFKIDSGKKTLEVLLHNNSNLWQRDYNDMMRNDLKSYKNQFKYKDLTYQNYKFELHDDVSDICDKYKSIGGLKLVGAIAESTNAESDIPIRLISPDSFSYARKISLEYATNRL